MRPPVLLLLFVLALAGAAARAAGLDDAALDRIAAAPAATLPAEVAAAVTQTPGNAAEIACEIVAMRPEAAPEIAAAAAAVAPTAAADIAFCAVAAASGEAPAIAAAVAGAAPGESTAIVEAACAAAPEAAGDIAEAVAAVVPDRADEIRAAAAAALARWMSRAAEAEPPREAAEMEPPPPPPAAQGTSGIAPRPATEAPSRDGAVRLTGGRLLVSGESEEAGYGLYSYLLFRRADTAGIGFERRKAVLLAFVQEVSTAEGLERAGVRRNEINVLYAPVRPAPTDLPQEREAVFRHLLEHYDFDRSRILLERLRLPGDGPYIVSNRTPLGDGHGADRSRMLVQDLARVPPRLAGLWMAEFQRQAARENFSDTRHFRRFALVLRTEIATLSEAFAITREAVAEMIQEPN